ncbi:MAG: hypothetical protein ACJ8LG_20900 [Massilia sp.]
MGSDSARSVGEGPFSAQVSAKVGGNRDLRAKPVDRDPALGGERRRKGRRVTA